MNGANTMNAKIIFVITQSLIKDVKRFVKKEMCGLVLKAKYIDKTFPFDGDDSDEKKLGRYFEYILTGAIPRNGVIPQAEYTKTFLKLHAKDPLRNRKGNPKDMLEPYKLAHINAARVKEYFRKLKIVVLKFNVYFEKNGKGGTVDIVAMYGRKKIVIDVKYSGLIHDKYSELGWAWTDTPVGLEHQRKFHGTQALQYHDLTGYDFYFLVVSSKNEFDIKFVEVMIDDFSREQHEVEVEDTRKKIEFYNEFGFNPVPELVRCTKCILRDDCQAKIEAPVPIVGRLASVD